MQPKAQTAQVRKAQHFHHTTEETASAAGRMSHLPHANVHLQSGLASRPMQTSSLPPEHYTSHLHRPHTPVVSVFTTATAVGVAVSQSSCSRFAFHTCPAADVYHIAHRRNSNYSTRIRSHCITAIVHASLPYICVFHSAFTCASPHAHCLTSTTFTYTCSTNTAVHSEISPAEMCTPKQTVACGTNSASACAKAAVSI